MKSIAFFDLDKTIYNTHSIFYVIQNQIELGFIDSSVLDLVKNELSKYNLGQQSYGSCAANILTIWVNSLKGKSYKKALAITQTYFESNKNNFYDYFINILPVLKKTHDVYLITTSSQFIAQSIVNIFELNGFISSQFEVVDDVFSGVLSSSLASGKESIKSLLNDQNIKNSIACGDSENDISMLNLVDHAFCINCDENLTNIAIKNNWKIITSDNAQKSFEDLLQRFS